MKRCWYFACTRHVRHVDENCPNDCRTSVFQDTHPWFSRMLDFSRTIKQGTPKKEFRERQRRERRKFGDLCEDFLPNRPQNDAFFLNLLKMSKFPLHLQILAQKWGAAHPTHFRHPSGWHKAENHCLPKMGWEGGHKALAYCRSGSD